MSRERAISVGAAELALSRVARKGVVGFEFKSMI
jgi:hypothetical protein